MKANRDNLRQIVIESLSELTKNSKEIVINEETNPIYHLGLDSMDGIEYACVLSEKLDFEIPDTVNPLIDDENTKRARSVNEVIDFLYHMILDSNQSEKKNERK